MDLNFLSIFAGKWAFSAFYVLTFWIVFGHIVRWKIPLLRREYNGLRVLFGAVFSLLLLYLDAVFTQAELVEFFIELVRDAIIWLFGLAPAAWAAPVKTNADIFSRHIIDLLYGRHGSLTGASRDYAAAYLPVFLILVIYLIARSLSVVPTIWFANIVRWLGTVITQLAILLFRSPTTKADNGLAENSSEADAGLRQVLARYEIALTQSSAVYATPFVAGIGLLFLTGSLYFKHKLPIADFPPVTLDPFAGHREALWIGAHIFMAEVLGFSLVAMFMSRPGWNFEAHAAAFADPRLRIFRHMVQAYPSQVLYACPQPEVSVRPVAGSTGLEYEKDPALRKVDRALKRTGLGIGQIAKVLDQIEPLFERDRRERYQVVIGEPRHWLHIELVYALAERNRSLGRSLLLIVPKGLVDEVQNQLKEQAEATILSRAHNIVYVDEQSFIADTTYTIAVVSDRELESKLLDNTLGADAFLKSVGCVAFLELLTCDVSRMRFQLERIWQRIDVDSIDIVVQSGLTRDAAQLAAAIAPRRLSLKPLEISLLDKLLRVQSLIIWRDEGSEDIGRATELICKNCLDGPPQAIGALQSTGYALRVLTASLAGAATTRNGDGDDLDELAELSQERGIRVKPMSGHLIDVLSLQERLVFDLSRPLPTVEVDSVQPSVAGALIARNTGWSPLFGLHVVSVADYALRDYQVARLGSVDGPDTYLTLQNNRPLTPVPEGGAKELLSTLYKALSQRPNEVEPGMRREDIQSLFLDRLPERLREKLASPASAETIRQLYLDFGYDITVDAHPVRDGTGATRGRRYAIRPTGAPPPNLSAELIVKTRDADQLVRTGEVPLADLGLKVFDRHHTLFSGRRYQVTEINRGAGEIRVARDLTPPRAFIPVVRIQLQQRLAAGQYQVAMPERALIESAESELNWVSSAPTKSWNRLRSQLFFAHFLRETACAIDLPRALAPLDPKTKLDVVPSARGTYVMERRYQPVLVLEFTLARKPASTEAAATLGVAIQDVIRAEFPQYGHRVHCLVRQAMHLFKDGEKDVLELHDKALSPEQRVDAMVRAHYAALEPLPGQQPLPAEHSVVEIVVLEDNESDLGIVHALNRNDRPFLQKVRGYLDWLVETEAGVSRYHRFGGAVNSSFLRFSEARELLPDGEQERIPVGSSMFPVFGRPRAKEISTDEAVVQTS